MASRDWHYRGTVDFFCGYCGCLRARRWLNTHWHVVVLLCRDCGHQFNVLTRGKP